MMTVSDAQAYRAEGAEQRETARLLAHAHASNLAAAKREDQVEHAVDTAITKPTVADRGKLVNITA